MVRTIKWQNKVIEKYGKHTGNQITPKEEACYLCVNRWDKRARISGFCLVILGLVINWSSNRFGFAVTMLGYLSCFLFEGISVVYLMRLIHLMRKNRKRVQLA